MQYFGVKPLLLAPVNGGPSPFGFFPMLALAEGPMTGGGDRRLWSKHNETAINVRTQVMKYLQSNHPDKDLSIVPHISYVIAYSDKDLIKSVKRAFKKSADALVRQHASQAEENAFETFIREKATGFFSHEVLTVFLSTKNIGQRGKLAKEFEANLIQTIIHETLHSVGEFPESHGGHDLRWLNEGFCEFMAFKIYDALYLKQHGIADEAYEFSYRAVRSLINDLNIHEPDFLEDFLNHRIDNIAKSLEKTGLTSSEIDKIFQLGAEILSEKSSSENEKAHRKFSHYIVDLQLQLNKRQKKESDSSSSGYRPPGWGGYLTDDTYSTSIEALREDASRKLSKIDLRNEQSLNEAEYALFRFVARFYAAYFGKPRSPVPPVYFLPAEQCGDYEKQLNGYYSTSHQIVLTSNAEKLDLPRKIYLLLHESAHACFWTNKPVMHIRSGFEEAFSEAITNAIASEVFSILFPRIKDKKVQDIFANRKLLADKVLASLGKDDVYRWHFGSDSGSVREILVRKYGFGADRLLEKASEYTDAPQTFLGFALETLERSKDESKTRIIIPAARFDKTQFAKIYDKLIEPKEKVRAIYNHLSAVSPSVSPYHNFVTAGVIFYASISKSMAGVAVGDIINSTLLNRISEGECVSTSLFRDAIDAVTSSPNVLSELKEGLAVADAILDIANKNQIPAINRIVETLVNVSNTTIKNNIPSSDAYKTLRETIMDKGWEVGGNVVPHIRSVVLNPNSGTVEFVIPDRYVGKYVVNDGGAVSLHRSLPSDFSHEGRFINGIAQNGEIPVIYSYRSGFVRIATPPTFDSDDFYQIPELMKSIGYYVHKDNFDGIASNHAANMVALTYDLVGSLYQSVQTSILKSDGRDAAIDAQRLFVAPDAASIKMIYDLAVLAKECVPNRSYTYNAAF